MNISGSTRVFMVTGDPVAQVQAPRIFNRLFSRHGVDAVLVPAHVGADRFASFAREVLATRNIDGLWVTIPHKPLLAGALDLCDRSGRIAQAVNAIRRNPDGSLEGALFDGRGFVKALAHFGFAPNGRRVLLVGAGGAGAAIAAALLDTGVQELALQDLGARAAALAARLAPHAGAVALTAVPADGADPARFDLVVNATPLGLKREDPLPFDVARLRGGTMVVDILMKHQPTPLLRACRARGIEARPGFEMLVQQVPDYLEFFGMHEIARVVQHELSDVRDSLQAQ